MVNVVVPMAGAGSRFAKKGYGKPKPFIDVNGRAMIECVLENLKVRDANYYMIAREEHMKKEIELVQHIQKHYQATFIPVAELTEGAACTVLHAHRLIDNEAPLLMANSDQIVDVDLQGFLDDADRRGLDGSILTFTSQDPKWSYAKCDSKGYVTEVREKEVISEHATVGIYYFKSGKTFVQCALDMIIKNERVNNEFYVCPVYNYAIQQGAKIGIYTIPESAMHGTGTPEDLQLYLEFLKQ